MKNLTYSAQAIISLDSPTHGEGLSNHLFCDSNGTKIYLYLRLFIYNIEKKL